MKAYVRRVGKRVCYTFTNGRFFFCDEEESREDLAKAEHSKDGLIDVDPVFYTLSK